MNFCSDNVSGVSREILTALGAANNGPAMPYGADEVTERVIKKLRELFEAPSAEVILMSTGSSANALALATMTPPFGAIYCHPDSHVNVDECGAPEFFSGGAKLVTVGGADGDAVRAELGRAVGVSVGGELTTMVGRDEGCIDIAIVGANTGVAV